jgi:DNA-binding MarR family transcriptional regulator
VESTARQAAETAFQLRELFRQDSLRIQAQAKSTATSLQVHGYLQAKPVASIRSIATDTSKTVTTVAGVLANLQQLGIVIETTGQQRNRVFVYQRCLNLIGAGTEPIPRLR